jgi:transcriptional regulator MftR-like protein
VRDRAKGESAVKVFRRMLLAGADRLGLKQTAVDIRSAGRIISASPSLIAREREMVDRYVARLAELLAEESGAAPDDVEPLAAASALMGAQRALVAHVRRRVLAGWQGKRLADDYRIQARRALSRMERGLAGYAVKA